MAKSASVVQTATLLYFAVVASLAKFSAGLSTNGKGSRLRDVSVRSGDNIIWSPCMNKFECGRLSVPVDYNDSSSTSWSLALIRTTATNPIGRLGTIMFNPGGPGESAYGTFPSLAPILSGLVDDKYDIVSWDTRGVNNSEPRITCFKSEEVLDIFNLENYQLTYPDGGNVSVSEDYQQWVSELQLWDGGQDLLARACERQNKNILGQVGTINSVRDMVRIHDALEGAGKPVNYWGISSGTALGQYFANMMPDRVGRMVLDGVVDAQEWATEDFATFTEGSAQDAELALTTFLQKCAEAGPDRCDFAKNSTDVDQLASALNNGLLRDVYHSPQTITNSSQPGILTSGMVKSFLYQNLLRADRWQDLASAIYAALNGDGSQIYNAEAPRVETDGSVEAGSTSIWQTAVTCADKPPSNMNLTDLVNLEAAALPTLAHFIYIMNTVICYHWRANVKERFTGPFNSTLANKIVLIGNTADPATSLAKARSVRKLLNDSSRLVIANEPGHTSLYLRSNCTKQAISNYFVGGQLPDDELWCEPDQQLFPDASGKGVNGSVLPPPSS